VIFRAAAGADLARLEPLVVADPASPLTIATFRASVARAEYRPEWTWIAEDGGDGAVLAAAIWWGRPGEAAPDTLDGLFAHDSLNRDERAVVAGRLIAAAHRAFAAAGRATGGATPDFHVLLPADWRGRRDVVTALSWRWDAAMRAGLTEELERLRFVWTNAAGLPRDSGRLTFGAEPDDGVFEDLFCRVLDGTLDATTRKTADAVGPRAQARLDVAFYRDKMPGDRGWWRVARTRDGEAVGFGIPSRNSDFPVVGYLGVLPEHRGHGYVGDILAEITRVLVAEAGAQIIHADTDLANQPMAAAFERAGYRNFARRVVLSAPLGTRWWPRTGPAVARRRGITWTSGL
jgi:RimJ/RimL family protein N-acetyltransferase